MREIALARVKPPKPGIEVEVVDLLKNTTSIYPSIRKACKAMNTTIGSIHRRTNLQIAKGTQTPYRNRYLIIFLKPQLLYYLIISTIALPTPYMRGTDTQSQTGWLIHLSLASLPSAA